MKINLIASDRPSLLPAVVPALDAMTPAHASVVGRPAGRRHNAPIVSDQGIRVRSGAAFSYGSEGTSVPTAKQVVGGVPPRGRPV